MIGLVEQDIILIKKVSLLNYREMLEHAWAKCEEERIWIGLPLFGPYTPEQEETMSRKRLTYLKLLATLGFASGTWSRPLLAAMLAEAPPEARARFDGAEIEEAAEGDGAPARAGAARRRRAADAAAAAPTQEELPSILG